jgi:glycosyltransferase involved in cell wall biosynthesis
VDSEAVAAGAREPLEHPWFGPGQPPVVLAAGRLHPQKNFSLLLRAFRHVAQARDARLVILGEGSERARLEQVARELGIGRQVLLPGFERNPFRWMARATVFVLPSLYEGFGNVIVEAMAAGCPIVATRCPYGPQEIVEDGVSGRLVPVGQAEPMARAVLSLLQDPALSARLALRGKQRALDFAPAQIAGRYEQLFCEF